jgi:high-affinity iron transporter
MIGRAAVLAALLLAAPRPPKKTPQLLDQGRTTYEIYCIACHGPRGEGDGSVAPTLKPRPRNFRTEPFRQGAKVPQIFATLSKGVPGTAMVKFTNLSDDERRALSWYVLDLRSQKR